jgi:hypothetical protein
MGAEEVRKQCDKNRRAIDQILQKLMRVIPATGRIQHAHAR